MRSQAWPSITFYNNRIDAAAILDFLEKCKNLLLSPIPVQCLPNLAQMIFGPSFTKGIRWIFTFQNRFFGRADQKRRRSRPKSRKGISQQPFVRSLHKCYGAMSCLAPPLLLAAIFIIIIIIIILRTGCLWQPPEALGQKFRNLAHSLGTVPWSSAQSFMSHTWAL